MPPTRKDPALADHLAWLGYVQPEGLVVSAPALVDAQAVIDRAKLGELQRGFAGHVADLPLADSDTAETRAGVTEMPRFFTEFLGWQPDLVLGWDPAHPLPESLAVELREFQETLRPTYAVTHPQPKEGASPWLLLVQSHPATVELDKPTAGSERGWHASPAKKFERLLRETQVPIGLLTNGTEFRLIYAPPKENSGTLTFPVGAMAEISGRLILGAFHLLLNSWTLFNAPTDVRLPSLLQRSRDYQASVSEKLAEQVLHALYELLRGFEAADERTKGALLRPLAAQHPEQIYGGLVTVLLRLVFVLFAEDRGLLPTAGLYVNHYAVRGLFERLRADAERYPDTMDHRFGAWAQLLALFRLIHGGCKHHELKMPAREGHLFDPNRYPFLEGRNLPADPIGALPLVSDGVLHRILEKLCILDGERVSYRTLDVEEIGSVYQTIMGFGVEVVSGTAVALKGKRKKGSVPAAPIVDLEVLLAHEPADRLKHLGEQADTKLTGEAERRVKDAATVDDLLAALDKRMDRNATPSPVAKGGLALQPNDERRRSGSHYTPRSFTEPIVRKTLEPVLARLGNPPKPQQILELKVADIAVGSAAFLVEACRHLGDALVHAWRTHGGRPPVPPDETEELLAMRLVAQRCLYGVDRNPMAVDLAKLSLWLATLAKDHPFTFLDHNLRCGDSLVGLTQKQIEAFTWEEKTAGKQRVFGQDFLERRIKAATNYRREILEGDDLVQPVVKAQKLRLADEALDEVRFAGDLIIAAFFAAEKDKARHSKLDELRDRYVASLTSKPFDPSLRPSEAVATLRSGVMPVCPFHWQVEFPEVFGRENGGFDVFVGNPPFLGGKRISTVNGDSYRDWLFFTHEDGSANADLVAHFFRRAFFLVRSTGCLGLIATNTIYQGDTRYAGLRWLRKNGGTIYAAQKRMEWPGQAAVVVSVVWVGRNISTVTACELDGQVVEKITAYLLSTGGDESPSALRENEGLSHIGSYVMGLGFLFADKEDAETTPLRLMNELIGKDASNREVIFPYISGADINDSPRHTPRRYVINFGGREEKQARHWPDLISIVEQKVKPHRDRLKREAYRRRWWQFGERQTALIAAIEGISEAMACSLVSTYLVWAFIPTNVIFAHKLCVVASESRALFGLLQSRLHETWTRFSSSTLGDALNYSPTDCFQTFPFPAGWETDAALEAAGREYYQHRAALMVRHDEGLTTTYNRFHATAETDAGILRLRELHAAMDRAVLAAYGWSDLPTACEFIPEYFEENADGEPVAKSIRFRWPDAIRDEVLARLLKLNAERAEEERLAGIATGSDSKPPKNAAAGAKRGRKPKALPAVATEPTLPTDFRLAFENPLLYSVSLVVSLLSVAGGSLPWSRLLDAFVLITEPDLLVRLAPVDDKGRAKQWATRWNEAANPEMLLPVLRQLGGGNLAVERKEGQLGFALQDGPRVHVSPDLAYDAWLALRIAGLLAPQTVPIPKRNEWTTQAETVLVA